MAALYTLLYLANRDDAQAIANSADFEDANEDWSSIWLRHIGDEELVDLWRVLNEADADSEGTLMANLLFQSDDEATFVMELPELFVTAVSEIQETKLVEVAQAWRGKSDFSRWQPQEIMETLTCLHVFCQKATSNGSSVLQVAHL